MNTEALINNFNINHLFTEIEIAEIKTNKSLRKELVNYFRDNRNRSFALTLLNTFIELRKDLKNEISIDDLMLASLLLGLHGQIEDSLKIWEAKKVDFDTYCGVDIQLVPFVGVKETIEFLKIQNSKEAKDALEYVVTCSKAGDFDNLKEYYSDLNWWV